MSPLSPRPDMAPAPEAEVVQRPGAVSLEGMHRSVAVPHNKAGFWKQMAAFFGPAVLVSVAYMDPGNWGTDLQGGAQFKYALLWVVGLASLMARPTTQSSAYLNWAPPWRSVPQLPGSM